MDRWTRRSFAKIAGLSSAAAVLPELPGQTPKRRLKPGHTGITWGYTPDKAEQAIPDVASQGFWGYETFGNYLEALEPKGGMGKILEASKLPLVSAYCPVILTDPAKRKDETEKLARWAGLIKKYGGQVAVIGPNNVKRPSYDFNAAKPDILATLNEMGKAVADVGISAVLHQHTGTCIEYRDEVYAIMEAVDTKVVKFGPDVGQLQKGGSDPVKVVKDFLPVIRHVHFKDFNGGPYWEQYCPLGQGKVDLPAVLDLLEKAPNLSIFMVELDWSANAPMPPIETVKIAKAYLQKQGYTFRS
jgi:inosose dehydratase